MLLLGQCAGKAPIDHPTEFGGAANNAGLCCMRRKDAPGPQPDQEDKVHNGHHLVCYTSEHILSVRTVNLNQPCEELYSRVQLAFHIHLKAGVHQHCWRLIYKAAERSMNYFPKHSSRHPHPTGAVVMLTTAVVELPIPQITIYTYLTLWCKKHANRFVTNWHLSVKPFIFVGLRPRASIWRTEKERHWWGPQS